MEKNKKIKRHDIETKIDKIKAEMLEVLNGPVVDGKPSRNFKIDGDIKDINEHDMMYELDDADIDKIQDLKSELKNAMDTLSMLPPRVDEIREEMGEILGIKPFVGIENEYEHGIGYQLDDCDVDRFQELRAELRNEMAKTEVKSKENPIEDPKSDPKPNPTEDPKPNPIEDPKPDPIEDPKPDPIEDPKPNPIEDPKPDPIEDPKPNPIEDPKPNPTEDPKPNPTEDPNKDDQSTFTVEYKVGRLKRLLLFILRGLKKISKVDGKFYEKLDKWESSIMLGSALTAGKNERITETGTKNVRKPENLIDKPDTTSKNKETEEIKNPDEIITSKEDILWINNKVEEMAEQSATIDTENDVFYNISSEELNNYKKMTQTHNAESLPKELKSIMDKAGLEEIEGINSKRIVYADMIAKSIRKYAQEKNIDLFDEENKNRSIADIMKDIDKNVLREKTNRVSREAAEVKNKEQDSREIDKEQIENEGEEK